jgi:hypothetical protein
MQYPEQTMSFFWINQNRHPAEMEKVILKACHEGAVVIIDELNSLPLEKMLNSLLSEGIDSQDNSKKGFFVVATQNPASFEGRQILSGAFFNRFHKVVLPSYPREELIEIVMKKGLKTEAAEALADKFEKDIQESKKNHKAPPSPRELFKAANEFVEAHDCHEIQQEVPDEQPLRLPENLQDVVKEEWRPFYEKLETYKSVRTNEDENSGRKRYHHFWGRIGGYSYQEKISATDKMLRLLEGKQESFKPRELKALRNARLGKILHQYEAYLPPGFKNKSIKLPLRR